LVRGPKEVVGRQPPSQRVELTGVEQDGAEHSLLGFDQHVHRGSVSLSSACCAERSAATARFAAVIAAANWSNSTLKVGSAMGMEPLSATNHQWLPWGMT
jgi:hypothetical protein